MSSERYSIHRRLEKRYGAVERYPPTTHGLHAASIDDLEVRQKP